MVLVPLQGREQMVLHTTVLVVYIHFNTTLEAGDDLLVGGLKELVRRRPISVPNIQITLITHDGLVEVVVADI